MENLNSMSCPFLPQPFNPTIICFPFYLSSSTFHTTILSKNMLAIVPLIIASSALAVYAGPVSNYEPNMCYYHGTVDCDDHGEPITGYWTGDAKRISDGYVQQGHCVWENSAMTENCQPFNRCKIRQEYGNGGALQFCTNSFGGIPA